MASRNERREISALHRASNGQGDPPHDGGKKRSRPQEDDTNSNETRRRKGAADLLVGIGRSNLQDSRTNIGRTLKRNNRIDIGLTGGRTNTNSSDTSLSRRVFTTPRTGVLDDTEPLMTYESAQTPPRRPVAVQSLPPGLSKDTNARMDGEDGESFTLAEVLGRADVPSDSPEREGNSSKVLELGSHGDSRSSPDPLNVIKPIGDTSHSTNTDDDDIVSFDPSPTNRPPHTPKGKTPFSAGRVKNTVEKFESTPTPLSRNSPDLKRHLKPLPNSRPGNLSQTTLHFTSTSKGSSSTGIRIQPGMTRPGQTGTHGAGEKISKRMQAKPKPSTGLILQSQGHTSSSVIKPGSRSKVQDSKPRLITYKLELQEWYCGGEHHESNKSKYSYELKFDGSKLLITGSEGKRVRRTTCLMKGDIDSFEVVDTDGEVVYPWLILTINSKVLGKQNWKNDGLGDSNRVLLHFKPDSDGIHDNWKGFIGSMANWAQKEIIRKEAMDGLVRVITDRSVFRQHTEPGSPLELVAPNIQDSDNPSRQRNLVPETRAQMKSTYSKPRTRSNVSSSNQADREQESKPVVIQDPDEVVLVHPTGTGSVTVNRGELARLEPGEFLNDTLIELGLKMWLNDLRLKDPTLVDQIHIFSSFFFKKLDAGRGRGCDYNSVKKWTSKFDLFSKRFIIIPINEHLHWYLAIICFPEHVLEAPFPPAQPTRVTRSSDAAAKAEQRMSSESDMQVDSTHLTDTDAGSPTALGQMEVDTELADKSGKITIDSPSESQLDVVDVDPRPNDPPVVDITNDDIEDKNSSQGASTTRSDKTWILILDSLGGKHPRTVRILREYLQAEAQERRGKVVDIKDIRSSGGLVEDKHLSVPVQPNWCDCGVYLLHYVEVFYANPLDIIALPPGAKRKPKDGGNRYDELWKTEQVKGKRAVFREKLHELSSKWLESKSLSPNNTAHVPGTLSPGRNTGSIPLSHLQADASIQEINPPESRDASTATTGPPVLPPGLSYPDPDAISPSSTIKDVEEVEGIVYSDVQSEASPTVDELPIDVSSNSSQPSSNSKSTRRGSKAGTKHGPKNSSEHGASHSLDASENLVDLTAERAVSVDL